MAYTHVSRLTTKSEEVFETVEAWIDFHGNIGEYNPLVEDFAADLDEDGRTLIRTMIYANVEDRLLHNASAGESREDRTFTVELVSESEPT